MTDYRFHRIGDEGMMHGPRYIPVTQRRVEPKLTIIVGKNERAATMPLTEQQLIAIIDSAARILDGLRSEREADARKAAK